MILFENEGSIALGTLEKLYSHSSDDKCRAILQWETIQAVLFRKSNENYL